MAELKGTLLFGYSKTSVKQLVDGYEERIKKLEKLNSELSQTIEKYHEKEQSISDALTEAKRLSKGIIADAELKAEKMVRLTEEGLVERVKNTENKLKELENTRKTIISHEEYMKVEMKQLLNRQMEMINRLYTNEIHDKDAEVERLLNDSKLGIEETRQTALGKNDSRKREPKITIEDDIPVFSF